MPLSDELILSLQIFKRRAGFNGDSTTKDPCWDRDENRDLPIQVPGIAAVQSFQKLIIFMTPNGRTHLKNIISVRTFSLNRMRFFASSSSLSEPLFMRPTLRSLRMIVKLDVGKLMLLWHEWWTTHIFLRSHICQNFARKVPTFWFISLARCLNCLGSQFKTKISSFQRNKLNLTLSDQLFIPLTTKSILIHRMNLTGGRYHSTR